MKSGAFVTTRSTYKMGVAYRMEQCSVALRACTLTWQMNAVQWGRLGCKHNFNVPANCKYEVIRKKIAQTGGPFRADNRTSAVVRIGHHESLPGSSSSIVWDRNLALLLLSAHDGNTPVRTHLHHSHHFI
jgi:hypothetical protein